MARLTPLSTLYLMLQSKLGEQSTQSNTKARYYQLLSDKQKWLAHEFDFPYLEDRWDIVLPSQSRYTNFPTLDNAGVSFAVNTERPFKFEVFWTNNWQEVDYGIGADEYNYLNSDNGEVQDPIQKWRWSANTQFEVWPKTSSQQTLRLTGQRALDALVADSDTADIDDQLLVLLVASDILARSKQADTQGVQGQAAEALLRLRGAYPNKPKRVSFSGRCETEGREERKRLIPIAVAGR